jgi:hypothetical protein
LSKLPHPAAGTPPRTIDASDTLSQLARILSALENERRNPNSKTTAIKAIERNAAQIGLSTRGSAAG